MNRARLIVLPAVLVASLALSACTVVGAHMGCFPQASLGCAKWPTSAR